MVNIVGHDILIPRPVLSQDTPPLTPSSRDNYRLLHAARVPYSLYYLRSSRFSAA